MASITGWWLMPLRRSARNRSAQGIAPPSSVHGTERLLRSGGTPGRADPKPSALDLVPAFPTADRPRLHASARTSSHPRSSRRSYDPMTRTGTPPGRTTRADVSGTRFSLRVLPRVTADRVQASGRASRISRRFSTACKTTGMRIALRARWVKPESAMDPAAAMPCTLAPRHPAARSRSERIREAVAMRAGQPGAGSRGAPVRPLPTLTARATLGWFLNS
jgi:hypothetical protein